MIVNHQKYINIVNKCGCKFDEETLRNAILWFSDRPVVQNKNIFMHRLYPAISCHGKKIHVHRIVCYYTQGKVFGRSIHVHHVNGDRMDARCSNLEIIEASKHMSLHNKGKILSESHRQKISNANKNRLGIKMKKRVYMDGLIDLYKSGKSINQIAKHYGCDWSTVRKRLNENPELLERKKDERD